MKEKQREANTQFARKSLAKVLRNTRRIAQTNAFEAETYLSNETEKFEEGHYGGREGRNLVGDWTRGYDLNKLHMKLTNRDYLETQKQCVKLSAEGGHTEWFKQDLQEIATTYGREIAADVQREYEPLLDKTKKDEAKEEIRFALQDAYMSALAGMAEESRQSVQEAEGHSERIGITISPRFKAHLEELATELN